MLNGATIIVPLAYEFQGREIVAVMMPVDVLKNRLPGADCNPYLALAVTLAAGYQGMMEQLQPSAPFQGNAYALPPTLPLTMEQALDTVSQSQTMRRLLGEHCIECYLAIKQQELSTFNKVITPWEMQTLSGIV